MRTLLALLLAAASLGATAGARIEKLAEGVYASIRTEPPGLFFDSNVLFIVNDEDVVVVDANFSLASARDNLAELRKITSKPVRYVVNTHWHDDHITGNRVYRDAFPGVEFVGHVTSRADMAGVGETNRQGLRANAANFAAALRKRVAEGTNLAKAPITDEERASYASDAGLIDGYLADVPQVEIIAPTLAVESRLTLQRGARTIEILHLGAGHSRADLVVHLPKEGIVATGDLVVWPVPLVGSTSFPSAFAATLEKLVALDGRMLMPGHGPVMRDSAYARQVAEVLRSITEQTRAAVARGETLEQARKSVDLAAYRTRFAGDSAARRFIFDGYVAGPGVAAAFDEASAQKDRGR
jgi:cyclase